MSSGFRIFIQCSIQMIDHKNLSIKSRRNCPPGTSDTNYTWIQQSVTFHV